MEIRIFVNKTTASAKIPLLEKLNTIDITRKDKSKKYFNFLFILNKISDIKAGKVAIAA